MGMLEDMGDYLAGAGIGLTQGTNLFISKMPDAPDSCVALYEYGGTQPTIAMGITAGGSIFEYPRLHIKARGERNGSANVARDTLRDVYKKLEGHSGTINTVEYLLIRALQQPFQQGPDQNERHIWACNFELTRRSLS